MDDLTRIATFVRVVEAGSLTLAARDLGVSLSVVSRRIKALEEDLGATLLLRTTRRLRVPDAGRAYYDRAVHVLRELEVARSEVQGEAGVRGHLTVSAAVTWGLLRLVPELKALRKAHPELVVELRLEDRVVDLVAEGIDVALRAGTLPDSPVLVAQEVDRYARVLAASPDYLARRGRPNGLPELADGSHDCLVHVPASTGMASWTLYSNGETREERTIAPHASVLSNNVQALWDAARDGLGIALLPEWMARVESPDGALERVLPDLSAEPIAVSALYHRATRSGARITAFLAFLRKMREA
jgi:DNA-binding transcriptional LysR family regulator